MGSRLRDVSRGPGIVAGRKDHCGGLGARHPADAGSPVWADGNLRLHHLSRVPQEIKRASAEFVYLSGRVRQLTPSGSKTLSSPSITLLQPELPRPLQWQSTE